MGDHHVDLVDAGREDGWALAADLADLSPESVIACDAENVIRLWSSKATALYGYSVKEAVGKRLDVLLHTRHPFGLPAIHAELLRDGHWSGELYRTACDGRELKVEAHWQLRNTAGMAVSGLVERSHDQTADEASTREAEITSHRYTNLFHAMAASFWEMDFSEVRKMIGGLVEEGVTDLRSYFEDNPDFIDEAIAATRIVDVNETTVMMFRAPSREAIMELPLCGSACKKDPVSGVIGV